MDPEMPYCRMSAQRRAAAGIDDRAVHDVGSALVGLEDLADVPDVGALVVLAVGV